MRILYSVLLMILLGTYWLALNKVKKNSAGLTPLLGWMVGTAFFVLAPLTILTLNGGFKFPAVYGLNGNWGEVDLSKPQFLGPYLIIWLSLMLTCAVAHLFCPASPPKKGDSHVVSRRQLERIILITMALSALDWIATIWLNGGIADFLVSHWYFRQENLVERLGSVFVLYARASLINQITFTGAAALYASLGLKDRNTKWRFTSLILFFFLVEIVVSGNRIFFAAYLLAFLTSSWLYGRKKIIAALLAASPLLVLVFNAWGWVRHDVSKISDSVDSYVIETGAENRAVTNLMDMTQGSAITLLMHVTGDFGNEYDYLYGSTYSRLFTFFQPRILQRKRIPNFETLAAQLYEPGETTSLGSTALGEAYANFGFLGIFVLPLFTWLALRYSEWLTAARERHTLLSAVSFMVFIWFARSTFAETAMTLIGVALSIWIFKFENRLCTRSSAVRAGGSLNQVATGRLRTLSWRRVQPAP
jgi:oligosaccharide repeat unit polymerase